MIKSNINKEQGFTLVELMCAVGIIGIMSAVAIPNFREYRAKSKQSEAKTQLAAVYAVEVATRADFETYGSCIADLGYIRPERGYYIVGFRVSNAASLLLINTLSIASPTPVCTATQSRISVAPTEHIAASSGVLPLSTDIVDTAPTTTTFMAGATGNISSNAGVWDKWTINEEKNLDNFVHGYRN